MESNDRLDKLETRVDKLEIVLNKDLTEIKTDLAVIKNQTANIDTQDDLKNKIIEEKMKSQTEKIQKLEDNQRWFVLAILGLVINAAWKIIFH